MIFDRKKRMLVHGNNIVSPYKGLPSLHSERVAIQKLFKLMKRDHEVREDVFKHGVYIFNMSVLSTGIKISRPCLSCSRYLQKLHSQRMVPIRRIWWTTSDDGIDGCDITTVANEATLSSGFRGWKK